MADFHILHSCPSCLIEGVLIETFEENSVEPKSFVCSFCQYEPSKKEGIVFIDFDQTQRHLREWVHKEGGKDVEQFCEMNFYGLSQQEVIERLLSKEPIASSFDVLEYLFPGFGGGGISITSDEEEQDWEEPQLTEEAYSYVPNSSIPVVARALAAVMLADGVWREEEEQLINQILQEQGLPYVQEEDKHGWMPIDLPFPNDPEKLVLQMMDVAFVDEELDESEWRVIKEFARYWGCDRKKLLAERELRIAPPKSMLFRLWNSIRTLLFQENV